MNVFYYLSNELAAFAWETNMHNIAPGDGCGLIDIYTKGLIPGLHDLQQRLADLAQANNDNSWMYSSL